MSMSRRDVNGIGWWGAPDRVATDRSQSLTRHHKWGQVTPQDRDRSDLLGGHRRGTHSLRGGQAVVG